MDAKESLDDLASGLIVIGFERGDGLAIRFAASDEEARGGILINLGESFLFDGWSKLFEAGEERAGLGFAIIDGSRLVP